MAKMLEKAQSLGLNVPHYHATLKTMKADGWRQERRRSRQSFKPNEKRTSDFCLHALKQYTLRGDPDLWGGVPTFPPACNVPLLRRSGRRTARAEAEKNE